MLLPCLRRKIPCVEGSGVSSHFGYWVQAIVACIILILILYLISIIIILITSVNFEPLCDHNDCCAAAAVSSSVQPQFYGLELNNAF